MSSMKFFLRRTLGNDYLDLLRFFLNHRTFLRSEHPEREGKSPTQLLIGESHPHWLELLGFDLFRKPAIIAYTKSYCQNKLIIGERL